MSLFQLIAVWSLRALVLWGVVELGAGVHDRGAVHLAQWRQIAGHDAALVRIAQRTRSAEHEAGLAEARLAAQLNQAWDLNQTADAASGLRQLLMNAGAQAPVVDAEPTPLGEAGLTRVRLSARWREPAASAPQALGALLIPTGAALRHLTLTKRDDGLVEAEADLTVLVRQTGARP